MSQAIGLEIESILQDLKARRKVEEKRLAYFVRNWKFEKADDQRAAISGLRIAERIVRGRLISIANK